MTSLSFPSLVLWFAPEEGVPGPCQRLVQPDHPMQVAQERKVFWFDDTALRPPLPARPRPTLAPPVPKSMPRRYGPSVITMVLSRAVPLTHPTDHGGRVDLSSAGCSQAGSPPVPWPDPLR